jgi:hypothetical protein
MLDDEVRVGMSVVDADEHVLGRVTRLDAWGFEVERGFWQPKEWVVRWDEVLEVRGTVVEVARSDGDLFELASGGLPRFWRRAPFSMSDPDHPAG